MSESAPKRLRVSELPDDNLPKTAWRCPFKSLICNIFDGYCESCGKDKDEYQGLDYIDDEDDIEEDSDDDEDSDDSGDNGDDENNDE